MQKATLQLCKSNVVIAECRILGLISELITAPLCRVIERNKHVLNMNNYYDVLLDFLKEQGQCVFYFINADKYPFEEELIVKDKLYDCLCIQDEKIDVIAVQVAQNLFTSCYKILNAAMKGQLPGGAFYEFNSEKITETSPVIPHNKLLERAFRMLNFLIRNRPNATTLTN